MLSQVAFPQEAGGNPGADLDELKAGMKAKILQELRDRFAYGTGSEFSGEIPADTSSPMSQATMSLMMAPLPSTTQYMALRALYNATGGANWSNNTGWVTATNQVEDVSNWYGVEVNPTTGSIVKVELPFNNLVGTLPSSISDLFALRILNLDGNQLTGAIPASLGSLSDLNSLTLSNNNFTLGIPPALGALDNLTYLNLSNNTNLGGYLHPEIGNMTMLTTLLLTYCNLQGGIPSTLRNLAGLQHLYLTGNELTGPIFSDINMLNSLRILQLGDNQLSGPIPATLLQAPYLEEIALYENSFSSPLPTGSPIFSNLRIFVAYAAGFTGAIPQWLADQSNLQTFNVGYNNFTGEIPENFMRLSSARLEFRVNNNPGLNGRIPPALSMVSGLVDISNCSFTFADFLNTFRAFNGSSFVYSPQGNVDVPRQVAERIGFTFSFGADVDRHLSRSFSKYRWYRLINGNEVPLQDSFDRFNWRYVTPYLTDEEYGIYFYKIVNDDAPLLTLRSHNRTLSKNTASLGSMGIDVYDVYCGVAFDPISELISGCTPLSYEWNFGDGNTSVEKTPIHVYASNGTYTVTLKVDFKCGNTILFQTTATKPVNFQSSTITEGDFIADLYTVTTVTSNQVLQSSVQTYGDNWRRNFRNSSVDGLSDFENGKSGVWNPLAGYFFDTERTDHGQINLATDGTYPQHGFSYEYPEQEIVPGWIASGQIMSFSEEGFEDESVDALGIYSANLYGYHGSTVIASAVNAKQSEILFTDFEDPTASVIGNWRLSHEVNTKLITADIVAMNRFLAVVDIPISEIEGFGTVSLVAKNDFEGIFSNFRDIAIICKQQHPTDPSKTILVIPVGELPDLVRRIFTTAVFKVTLSTPQTLLFDSGFAHTGKTSMKIINASESVTQDLMNLEEGKEYHFSAWASTGQSVSERIADPNLYTEVVFENEAGTLLSSTRLYPEPYTVDTWRRITGAFVVPPGTRRFKVRFSKGAAAALWIDDVRIMPNDAVMQSFVYETGTLRLSATLDEENYATLYQYDEEGNLRLLKRETAEGVVTVTEVEQYFKNNSNNP